MKNVILLCLTFSLFASSCDYISGERVTGNGRISTSERKVSSFDEVEAEGAVDVRISQGEFKPVQVKVDENLQEYIEVFTEGSRLVVRTKSGFNIDPTQDLVVYVTAPVYKRIDVSGACNITSENRINNPEAIDIELTGAGTIKMELNAPRTRLDISGAGDATLVGETRDFELGISGAGKAKCFDFKTETTTLDLSGAGDADVFASVKLDATASGAGSVSYKGNPKDVVSHASGASSIRKAD